MRDSLGYLEWAGAHSHNSLSYGTSLDNYQGGRESGPLVLYDADAEAHAADTLVLSTIDQHLTGILHLQQRKPQTLVAGVQAGAQTVPAGYSLSFALVCSRQRGVSAGVAAWGNVLRKAADQHGKNRKTDSAATDPTTHVLGYWTDNGGRA